jgi:hypothetical protein
MKYSRTTRTHISEFARDVKDKNNLETNRTRNTLFRNRSRFLQIGFFRPFRAFKLVVATLPGAYAPGYALFRPFGPNKEKKP